jgi:hypothetical protein
MAKKKTTKDLEKSFNLDDQFTLALELLGLSKESMPLHQYIEMRRAFFAGAAQTLNLLPLISDDNELADAQISYLNEQIAKVFTTDFFTRSQNEN